MAYKVALVVRAKLLAPREEVPDLSDLEFHPPKEEAVFTSGLLFAANVTDPDLTRGFGTTPLADPFPSCVMAYVLRVHIAYKVMFEIRL